MQTRTRYSADRISLKSNFSLATLANLAWSIKQYKKSKQKKVVAKTSEPVRSSFKACSFSSKKILSRWAGRDCQITALIKRCTYLRLLEFESQPGSSDPKIWHNSLSHELPMTESNWSRGVAWSWLISVIVINVRGNVCWSRHAPNSGSERVRDPRGAEIGGEVVDTWCI